MPCRERCSFASSASMHLIRFCGKPAVHEDIVCRPAFKAFSISLSAASGFCSMLFTLGLYISDGRGLLPTLDSDYSSWRRKTDEPHGNKAVAIRLTKRQQGKAFYEFMRHMVKYFGQQFHFFAPISRDSRVI